MRPYLLGLSLLLASVVNGDTSTTGGSLKSLAANPANEYTHLIFAIQWVGGVCADGYSQTAVRPDICLRESKRDHWTIHGVWPSSFTTSPEFCTTEQFDGRRLDDIKRQLNQYWPSFTSTQDRYFTFWRHEWQKHGTCAGDVPQLNGLNNFFKNVLNVFHRWDIKKYLDNSNITPSKTANYTPQQIMKAIADDYPYKFDVVCSQVKSKNEPVLSEVRFCLDKKLSPVNCQGRQIRCGNKLYYLPSE